MTPALDATKALAQFILIAAALAIAVPVVLVVGFVASAVAWAGRKA